MNGKGDQSIDVGRRARRATFMQRFPQLPQAGTPGATTRIQVRSGSRRARAAASVL